MRGLKIINANIVNEGEISQKEILIIGDRIVEIGTQIKVSDNVEIFDATGNYVIPGLIDDQVHFREPGLTYKASIETESKAALAEVVLLPIWKCQIQIRKQQHLENGN